MRLEDTPHSPNAVFWRGLSAPANIDCHGYVIIKESPPGPCQGIRVYGHCNTMITVTAEYGPGIRVHRPEILAINANANRSLLSAGFDISLSAARPDDPGCVPASTQSW